MLFISRQSDHFWLRCGEFHIWISKLKVKVKYHGFIFVSWQSDYVRRYSKFHIWHCNFNVEVLTKVNLSNNPLWNMNETQLIFRETIKYIFLFFSVGQPTIPIIPIADALPDHCSFKAGLWMYCVWHSIQYQFTTTWQHPQRWAKTGTRGISHKPSLQYVHGGQRSSYGGTSVEVVHELLSENSCLHWQPSTSCTTWVWPDHKRSFLGQMEGEEWPDPRQDPLVSK